MLLTAQLTVLEVAVFMITVVAFIIAIRFFLQSRKGLEQYLQQSIPVVAKKKTSFFYPFKSEKKSVIVNAPYTPSYKQEKDPGELERLKKMLLEQQSQLSDALIQINSLSDEPVVPTAGGTSLDKTTRELQAALERKDSEIQKLKQQVDISKKMQSHFDEMQEEFSALQEKLEKLEIQAWDANELQVKLENAEAVNEKLENDLRRKEEKLRELLNESQRLQTALHETEDKLNESNLQRQQLIKKMRFIEEMNGDMKQMADTNRKLQTELRRIAELESMLNLITEERDDLLKKGILKKF